MTSRESHIYVMPEHVRPGRRVRRPAINASAQILEKYYDELPEGARDEYDRLVSGSKREETMIKKWAKSFIAAYYSGSPLPSREFGTTITVDTSTLKGFADLTSMGRALYAVLAAGPAGVTSIEARRFGEVGGGISGSLAKLHRAGVVACLEEKR